MITQTNGRKVQLSATVRPELKELAEKIAKEDNTTVSGIITRYLEMLAQKRRSKLLEEGYKAMALGAQV